MPVYRECLLVIKSRWWLESCQARCCLLIIQFTFHTNDGSGNSDEQDIEIIGSKGADDGMPPAIELTNWNVSVSSSLNSPLSLVQVLIYQPAGKGNSHQSNPFPANPISFFHNYT
jgi:hypothetical protein